MLNPIWLKTFKTLIDIGHFTKTAEVLHMTQPGVSQHVNKLEAACGYPLIKRFNKTFELTTYGRKVYDYAVKHFEEESDLLQSLGHDEPFRGRCTIGCSGTFAWLIYPELLSLQSANPGLSIELEATPNHRILEQIQKGSLDIGLVTKKPNDKYFSSRVVGSEFLALVVPSSADLSLPLDTLLKDLGAVRHPDLDHYFHTYVSQSNNEYLNQLDLGKISIQSYINQVHQILVPVAKGIGFTVVPKLCVDLFPSREHLKIIDVDSNIKEPVYLVSKLNLPLARRYEQIIQVIERSLEPE